MAETFGTTTPGGTSATPIGGTSGTGMGTTPATMSEGATGSGAGTGGHTDEARSRFSAALAEAKAGAAALGAEARTRANTYRDQARNTGDSWSTEARTKASDLAKEGKTRASEALGGLSRIVSDNAATIDENLGVTYGDYVRNASKSLQDAAERLDEKSLEELGEDVRQFVRTSPGTAVGLAALAGFMFARIVRK